MAKTKSRIGSRSAINGRFVKKTYANAHPRTTVNERIPLSKKKK